MHSPTVGSEKLALLVVASERRFYLNLLILSLRLKKLHSIDHVMVVDTATDLRRWRAEPYFRGVGKSYERVRLPGESVHRVMRHAWSHLARDIGASHVLMFEEDFILLRRLPIQWLLSQSSESRTLQVVLPRQRWFEAEYAFPDRQAYLRARHDYRVSPEGDQLKEFFTNNPHCMRLDRILPLLEEVCPSDEYTWESEYARAAARSGMHSLHISSSIPWVWHVGAATSLGVRAAIASRRSTWQPYLRAHGKRVVVVAARWMKRSRGATKR